MNASLARRCAIGVQDSRRIIGLMSGTSLDGLDVALCHLTGHGAGTKLTLKRFATVPAATDVCQHIRQVFAREQVSLKCPTLLPVGLITACLAAWQVPAVRMGKVSWPG